MKKTVVLARNLEFDFDTIFARHELDTQISVPDGYIITSEPVEVEFTMLPDHDLTDKKVAIIDKQISKVRASLHQLEQQKQELLSLPAPE